MDDVRFLMSGYDYKHGWDYHYDSHFNHWRWSHNREISRSTGLSLNYEGWAVSATQRNTAVDRFLSDLKIDEFKAGWVVPPESKIPAEITKWVASHDVSWHRAYYALVDGYRDASPDAYKRLCGVSIVRTRSGQYRRAVECCFALDGDSEPEGVTIADPYTYSSGKHAKAARDGLARLGVKELNDETRTIGILNAYYRERTDRPLWDRHSKHIEHFIQLVEHKQITADKFNKYSLLLDSDKEWRQPSDLYAGDECVDANAALYYRSLKQLVGSMEIPDEQLRYEIDARYWNISGFIEFAKCIGVAYSIPISETTCQSNPYWDHLRSGGGAYPTCFRTNRDWHISNLDAMLQLIEQAKQPKAEREDLAKAIHATLDETREHTWPPPEHIDSKGDVFGSLVAVYRMNKSASYRTAPSQLVLILRKYAWVPQEQDQDGLVFVKPREARSDRLPDGFTFDSGWSWIRAIEFGVERREADVKIAEERPALDETAQETRARELGFENWKAAEEGRRFAELPEEKKKKFWERVESKKRRLPDFDKPSNPERRRALAKEEARRARDRRSEIRDRSVLEGGDGLREEARTMLLAYYEMHAHQSLCQVSDCEERSFKLKDDTWYFEAVRFLDLEKMHAADHLALCPRHAAMFQHMNESKKVLKQEFTTRCASGNNGTLTIPVMLAGESIEVFLHPNHVIDLEAALEVETSGERDVEDD